MASCPIIRLSFEFRVLFPWGRQFKPAGSKLLVGTSENSFSSVGWGQLQFKQDTHTDKLINFVPRRLQIQTAC